MALDDEWEVVSEEPLAAGDDPWAVVSEEPLNAPPPRLSDPGPRAGRQPGLRVQGNIDTRNLPQVPNADGSISTVRSMSFQDDQGREVLVPTVGGGRVMSDAEAIEQYRSTGRHLGMFDTPENATSFAQRLHEDQARRISQPSPNTVGETAAAYAGSRPQMPGVPGGGFFESLAEQLSMPSFGDVYQSVGATLARTVQGTRLQQLENEKAKLLYRVSSGGIDHYMASPEYLRRMSDDPRIVELDRKIAEEKAVAPEITADEQEIAARNPGLMARGTIGAANSIALAAPSLAYALTTRDPKGAAALAGIPTGATSYSGYREAGLTDARAARHALIDEAIEVGTEYLPIKAVLKPGTSAFRRFINVLGAELPGESIATIGQTLNEHIAELPEGATVDQWIEGLEKGVYQLPETWLTTILAGGVHTGAGELIQNLAERNREAKLSADADAAKERALSSAISLTNAIRGPQGRLPFEGTETPAAPPPGPGDLASIMRAIGAPPPGRAEPGIDMGSLSSVVPQDPFAPELPMRDQNIQPELPIGTIPAPDTTGSPAPEAGGGIRTAPSPPSTQGTATQPPPLSSAFQQKPAASPATPAPQEPAPTPAPHAAPAVSTAQEPPAGEATDRDIDEVSAASLDRLKNDQDAPVRVYTADPRGGLTTPDKPPPWRDIGSGWQAREFNERLEDETFPRQEIREPGGKRYTRGFDLEGKPLDVSPDMVTKFNQTFAEQPQVPVKPAPAPVQQPASKQARQPKPAAPTPRQGSLFDEEDTPAPAQAAPKAKTAPTVLKPMEERTPGFPESHYEPRGGWPPAGSWINEYSDGLLSAQELGNQLVNQSERFSTLPGVTDKNRKKLAKAIAGIKLQYERYADLAQKVPEKVLADTRNATRYAMQELATEETAQDLADRAESIRDSLKGSIAHFEYNIKEAKRVARETPKPKPAEKPAEVVDQGETEAKPDTKVPELPPPPAPRTKGARPAPALTKELADARAKFEELWPKYQGVKAQLAEEHPYLADKTADRISDELRYLGTAATFRHYLTGVQTLATTLEEALERVQPTPKPLDPDNKYPTAEDLGPVREIVPGEEVEGEHGEVVQIPTTEKKFLEVINEMPALFEAPTERVVAIYSPKHYKGPWLSKKEAAKRIESWQQHAQDQGERDINNGRVILSLFDLTGNWAQPYADAGYDVRVFDIQNGADVRDFSTEWFADNLPDISDVYGILIACPCTDFTVSGNQYWKQKDANGKTEASKELVFQALRTVEFWRPKFWVLENPVGRIAELTGLPPARLTFQPNAFGEPYTKITQLWGKFNANLPVAPVKPTEGSKMHSKYGGSSQRTKNARSETPEGFAAAFFMANNYADTPVAERLTSEFPDAAGAIEKALEAGFTEEQIREVVTDPYEDYETDEARKAVRNLVKTGEPAGEPGVVGQDEDIGTSAAERPRKIKVSKGKKSRKAASIEGMAEPTAEELEQSIAEQELREAIEEETTAAQEPQNEEIEAAADTEGSSRRRKQGERVTAPSTTRENLMEALGIDPTEFRLKGGQAQWEMAAKAIKDRYGYAGIYKHPRQTWRNAVDHLLDAFESLQNMATAMGQGNKIVSLNGVVSLYMREKPGRVHGYYRHQGGLSGEPNRTIAIFNQEDVYSHELGHALDYDLMERAGISEPGGLSRIIRKRGTTAALPQNLGEAMADVMTALYYDAAEIAQLIKKAEHQLEKAGTDKRRAELKKRLDNLRSGAWRGRGSKTDFYKRAKTGPMADYLSKPTELFARAFEAYISWKVQYQNELRLVKFLGATDALYRDEADAWIARIYPQANDRQQIFSAFDNLLGQLARENLYDTKGNPGWADSKLNIGLMDPVAQAKAEGTPITAEIVQAHNLTQKAAQTFVEDQIKLNDTLGKNWDQLIADMKAGKAGAADKFHAAMKAITSTPDGIFAFLERRYPNIPALRAIRDHLSDAAIHGRNKPVGVYREIQRQEASVRNRLEDRLKAVGITANMPAKWAEKMWDILHGTDKPANAAEKRQADQIRYELDYLWKLRDQTGESIGYIDYEYLPRAFLRNIADDPQFHKQLMKLRLAEKKELIDKLEAQMQKAKTDEEKKALRAKIKKAEAINVLKATESHVAAMKGMKWGEPVYLGALSEDSAKERVFGPLADKLLKDYYVKDPFTLLSGYGGAAARGMVMRKRFGENPNTVFQGWLDSAALGLPSAYADILLNAMQTSLGVRRDGNSTLARAVSAFANVQVAAMLGRSVLPNISEPLNILAKSPNQIAAFGHLLKASIPAIFKTSTVNERHAAADRFGRLSGTLVDAASSTTAMAQAMGEDVQGNGILARFSMRAYYFNLLSSLTALQEKVVNRAAFEIFYEAARIVRKGGKNAGMYRQWLREHGIADANAFADFLKDNRQLNGINFEDTLPGVGNSLVNQLANALDHFGKTTIQKPTPSTKHIQAHNGLIGIMYRLTSWMTTNFTNWAVYLKDKGKSAFTGKYGDETLTAQQRVFNMAIPVAAAGMAMYAAQAAFLVARMMLTHAEEWEDRGEDFWERFGNPKTQLQILQYWGGLGWLMSTSIDATEATRFNRGVTGTLLGPVYGGAAQDAERLIKLGVDQYGVATGEKLPSVAVRNNAAQAIYHQASVLATVGLLSVLPLKNPASRTAGFLWSFFGTSPGFQHEFADIVAGKKDTELKDESQSSDIKVRAAARKEIRDRQRAKEKFDRKKEHEDRKENRQ